MMVAKPSGRRSTAVEACDITLADLAPDRVVGVARPPSKIERATDYLKTALADGDWHPAGPILVELRRRELGGDSVVREARARAGVGHRKCRGVKDGPWEWQLATPSGEPRAMTPSTVPRAGGSTREDAFEFDGQNPNGTANLSTRQDGDTHPESRRRCSGAEELDASGENPHRSGNDPALAAAVLFAEVRDGRIDEATAEKRWRELEAAQRAAVRNDEVGA
jgi:hypothetical protein